MLTEHIPLPPFKCIANWVYVKQHQPRLKHMRVGDWLDLCWKVYVSQPSGVQYLLSEHAAHDEAQDACAEFRTRIAVHNALTA